MTEISASLVKELRESTGAGMMDCKRALQETDGDIDAARTLLREKGMAAAGKRADRATTEGIVGTIVEDGVATIVGLGCETEPVSKNDAFRAFGEKVLRAVHAGGVGRGRVVRGRARRAHRHPRREHRGRRRRAVRGRRPVRIRPSARQQDRRPRAARGGHARISRACSPCTSPSPRRTTRPATTSPRR